jgi:hypothetical protein
LKLLRRFQVRGDIRRVGCLRRRGCVPASPRRVGTPGDAYYQRELGRRQAVCRLARRRRTAMNSASSHPAFSIRSATRSLRFIRPGKYKQRPAHDDALRGLAGTMASPQMMCIRAKADIVEKPKLSHRTERVGHHGYPDTSHHYRSCSPPWRRRLVRPGTLVLGRQAGWPSRIMLEVNDVAPSRMMLSDHAATSNHWRIWLGRHHPTGNRAIIICYVLFGDPFINGHLPP